jgi:ABC-type sugar transport system ATPase subunit
VETRRASLRPKLLILDEPTAALSPAETEQPFAVIRRLGRRASA